jgi:hypothetical protein
MQVGDQPSQIWIIFDEVYDRIRAVFA